MDPAIVLRTVVLMLVAYLAGSIPVGVLVARCVRRARTRGRSAPGGPAGRTRCGRWGASGRAVVVIGDLLKGALPVLLARYVTGGDPLVEVLCGASAVAGAIWSRVRRVPERPRRRDRRRDDARDPAGRRPAGGAGVRRWSSC